MSNRATFSQVANHVGVQNDPSFLSIIIQRKNSHVKENAIVHLMINFNSKFSINSNYFSKVLIFNLHTRTFLVFGRSGDRIPRIVKNEWVWHRK